MIDDEFKHFVPQTLDDPPRLLFWDMDVAMVFVVVLGFSIMVGQMILGAILGVVLAAWFARSKSGRNRGYGLHLLYWYLPVGLSFKRVPPSSKRSFLG